VRQRRRILGGGDGFANRDSFNARDRDDVSQFGFGDVGPLQTGEGKQFRDLGFVQRAVEPGNGLEAELAPVAAGRLRPAADQVSVDLRQVVQRDDLVCQVTLTVARTDRPMSRVD